jgi:peroxiredoxin
MLSIPLSATSRAGRPRAPDIAIVKQAPRGAAEVVGHASPWIQPTDRRDETANMIVHFPDEASLADLSSLPRAVELGGRHDAAASIVCVISPEDLARLRPAPGVVFADDTDGWERMTGVRERPATVVIGTAGDIVWRHDGRLDAEHLAEALRAHLSPGIYRPRLLKSHLRPGDPAPDFLIASGGGEGITLSRLGRPAVLCFWKASSRPSVDSLARLRQALRKGGGSDAALLAIHAANGAETADASGDETAIATPDPDGAIAEAYGVSVWPTTVFIDESGVIVDVRSGLLAEESDQPAKE